MTEPERPPEETVYAHIKLVPVPSVLALNERDRADFLAAWDDDGTGMAWPTLAMAVGLFGSLYVLVHLVLR